MEPAPEGVRAGASELENDFLKVRLDPKTGWIASLYDKTAEREVLAGPGNVLEAIIDEPKEMSAWELGLKGLAGRAGENGADRGARREAARCAPSSASSPASATRPSSRT